MRGQEEYIMSKNSTSRKILAAFATAAMFGVVQSANAASFAVKEQNVANLGYAYAGTASLAEDASTGFYNPAGLINMDYDNVALSLVGMKAHTKLEGNSATINAPANSAATGNLSTKPKGQALLPALHIGKKFGDYFAASFNITVPFGLKSIYRQDSAARYVATKSQLKTVDFGISAAYKVNDQWSLGLGLDALRAEAWLNTNCRANPALGEGYLDHYGKGWSYGFHLGIMYNLTDATRMGLAYHSKFSVRAKGDAFVNVPGAVASTQKTFTGKVNLPERLTYSIQHQYNDKWAMLADVELTHWSKFKKLRLDYSDGTFNETPENYKNTIRVALGTNYKLREDWDLKLGLAYDQSPTRNENRTARIPDSDRIWLGLGTKYNFNQNFIVNVGYAHLFFKNASIDEVAPNGTAKGAGLGNQTLKGTYKTHADIVGIQLTWNFV
jgi:long-chain fatty acid transport protein